MIQSPDQACFWLAAAALRVGQANGQEVYAPFKALLPMVEPNDIVFDGWDISGMNLADAMGRAAAFASHFALLESSVLDQTKLIPIRSPDQRMRV